MKFGFSDRGKADNKCHRGNIKMYENAGVNLNQHEF